MVTVTEWHCPWEKRDRVSGVRMLLSAPPVRKTLFAFPIRLSSRQYPIRLAALATFP